MSDTGKLSGMAPTYRLLDGSELMLTIPSAPIDDREKLHRLVERRIISDGSHETINGADETINNIRKTIKESNETIKGDVEAIFETIKSSPGVSLVALVKRSGKSRASVARIVSILKQAGAIEHRGSKKTGGYYCK